MEVLREICCRSERFLVFLEFFLKHRMLGGGSQKCGRRQLGRLRVVCVGWVANDWGSFFVKDAVDDFDWNC